MNLAKGEEIEERKRQAGKVTRPETREQKRYRERINKEAAEVIKRLQDKFSDFFTTCENPEGEETTKKIAEISAQWRTHCKRRNLVPAAYPVIDTYMEGQVKQYYELKENPEKVISKVVND
jgi:hypothetical protein